MAPPVTEGDCGVIKFVEAALVKFEIMRAFKRILVVINYLFIHKKFVSRLCNKLTNWF